MTGRKASKTSKTVKQRAPSRQQNNQADESPPNNLIRKEQPPQPQIVKKILKTENDEARTLKTVFKSNPDSQMKEFIQKGTKPMQVAKNISKTPAENHPPAVAQELLETDDDVADNLAKLFKASKSYKNVN